MLTSAQTSCAGAASSGLSTRAAPSPDDAEPPDVTGTLARLTTGPHRRFPVTLLSLFNLLADHAPLPRDRLQALCTQTGVDYYNAPRKYALLHAVGVIASNPDNHDYLTPLGQACRAWLATNEAIEKARDSTRPTHRPRSTPAQPLCSLPTRPSPLDILYKRHHL